MDSHLRLHSGKTINCWSPWCSANCLQLKERGIRVYFNMKTSDKHAKFIFWIRRLICTKKKCSLLQKKQLTSYCKWETPYKIPVKTPNSIEYKPFMLVDRQFRVQLQIVDRGSEYRLISDGYPKLHIHCFEFGA